MFTFLEGVVQALHSLFCKPFYIFAHWLQKWGSVGPTVVYALHKWLISHCSQSKLKHSSRCMFVYKHFHNKWSASIIDDSRSGMGDVAFRSAPPVGGLFCCSTSPYQATFSAKTGTLSPGVWTKFDTMAPPDPVAGAAVFQYQITIHLLWNELVIMHLKAGSQSILCFTLLFSAKIPSLFFILPLYH